MGPQIRSLCQVGLGSAVTFLNGYYKGFESGLLAIAVDSWMKKKGRQLSGHTDLQIMFYSSSRGVTFHVGCMDLELRRSVFGKWTEGCWRVAVS